MSILLYILFLSCVISVLPLNNNEFKISFELSKKLNINYCIFVENKQHKNINLDAVKIILPTSATFLNYDEVCDFVKRQNNYFRVMLILKVKNASDIQQFLQKLKDLKIFHKISQHTWLAFLEDEDDTNTLSIRYDCQFLFALQNNETTYKIMEIYNANNKTFYLHYGMWDQDTNLKINDAYIYLRRRDLNQTVVQLRFTMAEPLETYDNALQRLCDDILYSISNIMNFKFEIAGIFNKEGKMYKINDYQKLQPDFVDKVPYFLLADTVLERSTNPIFRFTLNWFIKYPNTKLRSNFYLAPFGRSLWSAIITFMVTGTILLITGSYFLLKNRKRCIIDDTFSTLEYFCSQDGGKDPGNISFRVVKLTTVLLSFVLLTTFGAVVTSYLAVEIPEIPFVNLETFRRNGEYRLLGFNAVTFALEKDRSTFKEKWGNFVIIYKAEEQLKLICEEKVAFAKMDYSFEKYEIPCNLYQINEPIAKLWFVVGLSKDNPFRTAFNYHLIHFYESGVQNRMQKILELGRIGKSYEDELQIIRFEQVRDVLLIPFIGILIAAVILIGELFIKIFKLKY